MNFDEAWLAGMEPAMQQALADMDSLEGGAVANPDEKRMVGHYWLRTPALAPAPEIRAEIESCMVRIREFAAAIHAGGKFTDVLSIGIGGSALGPMFVADALGHPSTDKLRVHFFDNTDPDGIERTMASLAGRLDRTLVLVISKSGGTPETYNGMKLAEAAYARAGVDFASRAVAITMAGSKLDAYSHNWLDKFPMFDWVGGRTSELSAVGLLVAALQGLDIDAMVAGASACDEQTRSKNTCENPAALLALMWHHATGGKGLKDMVVLPYKDRLLLFSRYLQQLVMESIGKEFDLEGRTVNQGIAVYGNKGSTDQHAYVQQLREGVNNFFVTFLEVLKDRGDGQKSLLVEKDVTSGDYLTGFLLGTRRALHDKNRTSVTITLADVSPRSVGLLIALYERTVGLYAQLVNINAYHQPGVEAGKKAAGEVLALQHRILAALRAGGAHTAEALATALAADTETVFKVLEHLAANPDHGVTKTPGATVFDASYGI